MILLKERGLAAILMLAMSMLCRDTLIAQDDSLVLENLGPNINSRYDEVGPVISPDGKTLYFDRSNHPDNFGDDDIWVSTLRPDGSWSPAVNFGPPLNNRYNNFVCSVTPDGNTLLLGNVYLPDGTMGPGASIVRRTRNGWGKPEALKIRNYYSVAQAVNYRLANDGRTLLMSVQRSDGYGEMDLYVSFLEKNGEWSEPLNLGPDVNTAGFDRTPFLAADGETLYFASDGHGGFGSSDIFVTRRLDSTWRRWSPPENLGRPISTEGWDGFFTLPASGDYAYLVSSQNAYGAADIFRVKLTAALRPKAVALVSGRVLDARTRMPIAGTVVYQSTGDAGESGTARSDPRMGTYKITLPAGESYGFSVSANGYLPSSDRIDLSAVDTYREITRDFLLTPVKGEEPVTLNSVYFHTGSAELLQPAIEELDGLVKYLKANPATRAEIAGHTDNVGADDSNEELSRERADAVVNYLESQGIDAGRLVAQGYGESRPVASNATAAGRKRNRRVEFRLLNEESW